MSSKEKKEKEVQEGSKTIEDEIKAYRRAQKTIASMVINADQIQRQLAKAVEPSIRALSRNLVAAQPALQAMASTMATIDISFYQSLENLVHISATLNIPAIQTIMRDFALEMNRRNKTYLELAEKLSSIQRIASKFEQMDKPISVEPEIFLTRDNSQERIAALEDALVRLKKELDENKIEKIELRQIIEGLLKKTKKKYIA